MVPWVVLCVAEARFRRASSARRGPGRAEGPRRGERWQVPVFAMLWGAMEEAGRCAVRRLPVGSAGVLPGGLAVGGWRGSGGCPWCPSWWPLAGACLAVASPRCAGGTSARERRRPARRWRRSSPALLVPLDTAAQDGRLGSARCRGTSPTAGWTPSTRRARCSTTTSPARSTCSRRVAPGELDVVLWPENGSDIDPRGTLDAQAVRGRAGRAGRAHPRRHPEYPSTGGRYNISLLWDPRAGRSRLRQAAPRPVRRVHPACGTSPGGSRRRSTWCATDMLPGHRVGLVELTSRGSGRTVGVGRRDLLRGRLRRPRRDAVAAGRRGPRRADQQRDVRADRRVHAAARDVPAAGHRARRATVQISTVGVSAIITPAARGAADGAVHGGQLVATCRCGPR